MARLTIDTGTLGNTATGDSLRGAFTKVNANFEEIYNELGSSGILSDLSFAGNTISTDGTNQNLILDPNGTGKVIIEGTVDLGGLSIASQTITGLTTNSNITLSPAGTGAVDVDTSRIINVSDPSSAQDAATKNYVDTQLASSDHSFTFVGDDSSGTAVTQGETFKFAGTQNITTAVSGDTLTITGPDLTNYLNSTQISVSGNKISTTESNANIELDPNGTGDVIVNSGDILPATDNTQYLGSASKRWHTLYVGPGSININGVSISESSGTIQIPGGLTGTQGLGALQLSDPTTLPFADVDNQGAAFTFDSNTVFYDTETKAYIALKVSLDPAWSGWTVGDAFPNSLGLTPATFTHTHSGGALTGLKLASGGSGMTTVASDNILGFRVGDPITTFIVTPYNGLLGTVNTQSSTQSDLTATNSLSVGGLATVYGKSIFYDSMDVKGNKITNLGTPTADTDAATKAYVDTQNQSQALTFVGDDSTGTAVNSGETFRIAGTQNITTAVSGDTLTITGPDLSNYLQNTGTQTIDNLSFNDNIISTSSNADLILDPGGTGDVRINTDKISLGNQAGETTQGDYAVALGYNAGTTSQGGSATAVGDSAGQTTQGAGAVAVGVYAGNTSQGASAVAVGNLAGNTSQGGYAVAVGNLAGQSTQGINAVAIGDTAGQTNQGASAIAIGKEAGHTNQAANSIVINATNSQLNNTTADALIIKPIRNTSGTTVLQYDSTTGEITHSTLTALTVVGDDSTGTAVTLGETFRIAGAGSVTTAVSGDTITITGTDTDTTYTAGTGLQLIGSAFSVDATVARTSANITIVGDDSTGTAITLNETFKIAGGTNITTAVSGDTLTITGPDLTSYATQSYVTSQGYITNSTITVVGDDSTGTSFNTGETIKVLGAGGITGSVSGDTLTVDGSNLLQYARVIVVGDDSTGSTFDLTEANNTLEIQGAGTVTTAVSGNTVTITGPDLSNYLQNTGTQTIDNLTFNDNIIGTASNADLILDTGGTGKVRIATDTISLGNQAGVTSQGNFAVAIGYFAGETSQGAEATAVGDSAGKTTQGAGAVAVGVYAGYTGQGASATAVGNLAGETNQGAGAVAVGIYAGKTTQGASAIAIGGEAGETSQGDFAVAIGYFAGETSQGNNATAIGDQAGETNQGAGAVAVGVYAGETTQGNFAVAIGIEAGQTTQGTRAVAVGNQAGKTNQGADAVAVGGAAGETNQAANSIVLNATGAALNNIVEDVFIVKPVRGVAGATLPAGFKQVAYNPTTGEFIYYDM
jgi:hypothetical protein